MPNALVVADDLTGALDTGHGFAARGRGVRAHLADSAAEESLPTATDVLAVDTDSREAAPAAAGQAVRRVVAAADARIVYKKVDSTLRGNVVAEVDAALAASGAPLAVVAPAFPGTGRTTRDGVHRVDGTPLADAGYGVGESSLPRFLASSTHPVEHLPLSVVDDEAEAVAAWLSDTVDGGTPTLVACDAVTDAHLAAIAAGAERLAETPLYVGSGGLAEHVTVPGEPAPPSAPRQHDGAGMLGVVGSVNPQTLDQLAAVPSETVVEVDPRAAVVDPDDAGREVATDLARLLGARGRAVVTAATQREDTERAVATAGDLARETGTDVDAGERVARALATATAATIEQSDDRPRGLVLTGGDIARATLDALDATGVVLAGEAVEDGLPIGWLADGPAAGTRVVTKAGGFGGRRSIVNSIQQLSGANE